MNRSRRANVEHRASMRVAGAGSQQLLLPAGARVGREPGVDAADRRAVFEDALFRQSSDDRRVVDQSQTRAAADGVDGHRGDLPEATAAHVAAGRRAQDLPVFTAECGNHAARSSLVERHHVHSGAAGLLLSDGGDRLAQPVRAGLAVVEHVGRELLLRGARRSVEPRTTGIKAPSSRPKRLLRGSHLAGSRSAWTVAAGRWTTCSSSGYGERSNTRRSIERSTPTAGSSKPRWPAISSFIARSDAINRWATARRPRFIGPETQARDAARPKNNSKCHAKSRSAKRHPIRVRASATARDLGRVSRAANPNQLSLIQPHPLSKNWGPLQIPA